MGAITGAATCPSEIFFVRPRQIRGAKKILLSPAHAVAQQDYRNLRQFTPDYASLRQFTPVAGGDCSPGGVGVISRVGWNAYLRKCLCVLISEAEGTLISIVAHPKTFMKTIGNQMIFM